MCNLYFPNIMLLFSLVMHLVVVVCVMSCSMCVMLCIASEIDHAIRVYIFDNIQVKMSRNTKA